MSLSLAQDCAVQSLGVVLLFIILLHDSSQLYPTESPFHLAYLACFQLFHSICSMMDYFTSRQFAVVPLNVLSLRGHTDFKDVIDQALLFL